MHRQEHTTVIVYVAPIDQNELELINYKLEISM